VIVTLATLRQNKNYKSWSAITVEWKTTL